MRRSFWMTMQFIVLLGVLYLLVFVLVFTGIIAVAYLHKGSDPDSILGFFSGLVQGGNFSNVCIAAFSLAWRWPIPVFSLLIGAAASIFGGRSKKDE